jgi:hypothetical protein
MPLTTLGVQHGQPRLTAGIETSRSNATQLSCGRFFPILPIHVQEFFKVFCIYR